MTASSSLCDMTTSHRFASPVMSAFSDRCRNACRPRIELVSVGAAGSSTRFITLTAAIACDILCCELKVCMCSSTAARSSFETVLASFSARSVSCAEAGSAGPCVRRFHGNAYHGKLEVNTLGAGNEGRCFCGGQQTVPTERKDEVVPDVLSRGAAQSTRRVS